MLPETTSSVYTRALASYECSNDTDQHSSVHYIILFQTSTQPAYISMLATEMSNDGVDIALRTAAALAIKNALTAREAPRQEEYTQRWLALPQEGRSETKGKALSTLATPNESVGRNAAQVIAAIAAIEVPAGQWSELIAQLLTAIRDQSNERLRQSALQAIGFVCEQVVSNRFPLGGHPRMPFAGS